MPEVDPRAYLVKIRNVRKGVLTRSRILEHISGKALSVGRIAEEVGRSRSAVRRHLKNMEAEGIVRAHRLRGKMLWTTTGAGQRTLEEVI